MFRACILPNDEYKQISENKITKASEMFYKLYENTYGPQNCTYSTHIIGSHIEDVRGNEPLTERSAFKFKNFYSELRELFQPGTLSPTKQLMKNCYMKRQLERHSCSRKIHYDTEKSSKESNNMIYLINAEKEYEFYNIIKINHAEGTFTCNKQGRYIYKCDLTPQIQWETVGVFIVGPFSDEEVLINKKDVKGKVMRVQNLLITCPNNVLREQ